MKNLKIKHSSQWRILGRKFDRLGIQDPSMDAIKINGNWKISGTLEGCTAFLALAIEGAHLSGCTSDDPQTCLNYWMNQIKRPPEA